MLSLDWRTLAIVLAAYAMCSFTVAHADAPLDPTFSYDGRPYVYPIGFAEAQIHSIAQDLDHRLVTGGYIRTSGGPDSLLVTRHKISPPGVLDTSFNGSGFAANPFGTIYDSPAAAIAIDHHGRIVEAGNWELFRGSCGTMGGQPVNYFAVGRFLNEDGANDGKSDPEFQFGSSPAGIAGVLVGDCESSSGASALAIGSDDSVVAIGNAYDGVHDVTGVVKWTPTGALDSTFGSGSIVMLPRGDFDVFAGGVAVDRSNRIIVAAWGLTRHPDTALVYRLNSDGTLDSTFGDYGVATFDFLGPTGQVCCIALDADEHIVIAGDSDADPSTDSIFVARVNSDGTADKKFGSSGFVNLANRVGQSGIGGLTIDDRGRPLVAGSSADFSYATATLIHLNRDGSINASVGLNGVFTVPFGFDSSFASAVLVDELGRPTISIIADDRLGYVPALVRFDELFGDGFD